MRRIIVALCLVSLMMIPSLTANFSSDSMKGRESTIIEDKRVPVFENYRSAYIDHEPIVITQYSNFSNQGWPGDGSSTNPYRIQGLNITGNNTAIKITDTTDYFEISNCILSGDPNIREGSICGSVYLYNAPNGRIENCTLRWNRDGLWARNADNLEVVNCTIQGNYDGGFEIHNSDNIVIENCTITGNIELSDGISISDSTGCLLLNNTFSHNEGRGVVLWDSQCLLINNTFFQDTVMIHDDDLQPGDYSFTNNKVNGKILGFFFGLSDTFLDVSEYGQVILASCVNITITNGSFGDCETPIYLKNCDTCTISGNQVENGDYSALISRDSPNTQVIDNVFLNSIGYAMQLISCPDSLIEGNVIMGTGEGVRISGSSRTKIQNNMIDINHYNSHTHTMWDEAAIYLNSHGCKISDNDIRAIWYGVRLEGAQNSDVSNNVIQGSSVGIRINSITNCTIFNNTISNNQNDGIRLLQSSTCNLTQNNLAHSSISIHSNLVDNWQHTINDNTLNSLPIAYYWDVDGISIPTQDYGQLIFANCRNLAVTNVDISNTSNGLLIGFSDSLALSDFNFNDTTIGAKIVRSDFVSLSNSNFTSCSEAGVYIEQGDNFTITDCRFTDCNYGILVENTIGGIVSQSQFVDESTAGVQVSFCYEIEVKECVFTNTAYGVYFYGSQGCAMLTNSFYNGSLAISGSNLAEWNHNVAGNEVNGKPLGFFLNQTSITINGKQYGQIMLVNCSGVVVENVTSTNIVRGLDIAFSDDCYVANLTAYNVRYGIQNWFSFNTTISHSNFTDNEVCGIQNAYSDLTKISDNRIQNCRRGVLLHGDNCTVTNNTVISNSEYGIWVFRSWSNIYNNSFLANFGTNANDLGANNIWDDGSSIGNIWSDYSGGPNYTIPGDAGSVDRYPISLFDTTPPTIDSLLDVAFEFGDTSQFLIWNPVDLHAFAYEILIDGEQLIYDSWTGKSISFGVEDLPVGVNNVTIVVYDGVGNTASDSVDVTIEDTTAPVIHPADDVACEISTSGHIIWFVSDSLMSTYEIYVDEMFEHQEDWNTEFIIFSFSNLTPGDHNVTLVVFDTQGNSAKDEVIVTAIDSGDPVLNSPDDIFLEVGTSSVWINWTATDAYLEGYQVLQEGVPVASGDWVAGPGPIGIDGSDVAVFNFTILVWDTSGNLVSDTVMVHLVDTTSPTLSGASDVYYTEGETGNNVTWTGSDLLPNHWELYINSTLSDSDVWVGGSITASVDGLLPGTYNVTIVVYDTSLNFASESILVFVAPSSITTSTTETTTSTTSTTTTSTTDDNGIDPNLLQNILLIGAAGVGLVGVLVICSKRRN
ncbi:MAG: right-handed parallel beta-helix repeat-containing protein [Candidatus Thorarchaeota archaeon]